MKIEANIKLAVIAGAIMCTTWYFMAKSLGFYSLHIYTYKFYISLFLLFAGIFFSIFYKKKSQGFISFKIALKTGIVYALLFGAITAVFNYIYHKTIVPDAIDFFASEERKAWLSHGRSLDEVNKYLSEYYIPSFGSFHLFMVSLIWGILLSLLCAAILRKTPKTISHSAN